MKLFEIFNTDHTASFTRDSFTGGHDISSIFEVNDHKYKVVFSLVSPKRYDVNFYLMGDLPSYKATNLGDQFSVLSGVASTVIKFINKYSPKVIEFSAGVSTSYFEKDDIAKKEQLYGKMAQILASKYGGKLEIESAGGKTYIIKFK